jgi:lysozyme family protein
MIRDFDSFFEWLMRWEGETLENVPGDRGGPTRYGIDQRSHPDVVIAALTRDRARRIYATEFGASYASELPAPLCWALFDGEINQGKSGAARCLQLALGTVRVDGVIGRETKAAVRRAALLPLTFSLLKKREERYKKTAWGDATLAKFLPGWLNRVESLRKELGL